MKSCGRQAAARLSEFHIKRDDRHCRRSYRDPGKSHPERTGEEPHPDRLGVIEGAPVPLWCYDSGDGDRSRKRKADPSSNGAPDQPQASTEEGGSEKRGLKREGHLSDPSTGKRTGDGGHGSDGDSDEKGIGEGGTWRNKTKAGGDSPSKAENRSEERHPCSHPLHLVQRKVVTHSRQAREQGCQQNADHHADSFHNSFSIGSRSILVKRFGCRVLISACWMPHFGAYPISVTKGARQGKVLSDRFDHRE